MVWTLADIESKTRLTTGRPDTSMISQADLRDRINKYYQFVLPKELKIFFGYTYYNFFTLPNIDQYTPPANFQTLNPSIYMDGFPGDWYLSPDIFFQDYPIETNKLVVAQGNGVLSTFVFSTSAFPVLPNSFYITDGVQIVQDDGSGNLIGNGTGTINYITGAGTVNFTNPPANGANIETSSQTYMANRPQGLLYYDNVFTLRPVPDDVYLIKMEGINIPTALANPTDAPFRPDLGPLIAYGTSLEIFADFNQMDQYQDTLVQYNRYKDISMQDTYEEYMYERSVPKF